MIRMEDIEENARKLLQAGDTVIDEDVVDEFYPEQAIEQMKEDAKLPEKPNYAAQELKVKLDAGDKEVEGYSKLKDTEIKGPTVDPLTGEDLEQEEEPEPTPLEQDEPQGTLPDGVDALSWLIPCRPTSSVANAKSYLKVFEEQESEINMLADRKMRDRLIAKQKLAKSYLAAKEPAEFFTGLTLERLEFEETMRTYMGIDEQEKKTRYQDKLNDLGFLTMADVKGSDETVVLGFLAEEFGE
jgi:hypothetical protein